MNSNTLKIAIISDLHCHPKRKNSKSNSTYLFSDLLRIPSEDHPVENLIEIINRERLNVELLLSPGDFTDQADIQGFLSGWAYVNEISAALNSNNVIATIGNHDIDSRHTHSNYSFELPKSIKQNFPLRQQDLKNFWGDGFSFVEASNFQILVIDSTHFHTHFDQKKPVNNPAVKGKIDLGQIEKIQDYLAKNKAENKIKLALCHHPPVSHSRLKLGEHDYTENGNMLLDILGIHKFDLFIYGHKHDPWLRYYNTTCGFSLPLLSSGSFSATDQILWAAKYNYFHVIDLVKKDKNAALGKIKTWNYKAGVGWSIDKDESFLPYTGFGFKGSIKSLVKRIKSILIERGKIYKWEDILKIIPEIENLTPDKMDELEGFLSDEGIIMHTKIGMRPKHIYYE